MKNPLSCHVNVFVPSVEHEGFERALDDIATIGFDWVGLPPLGEDVDIERVGRQLDRAGLRPVLFAVQREAADISSPDRLVQEAGRRLLDRTLSAAVSLRAPLITGVPYAAYGRAGAWANDARDRSAAALSDFAATVVEAGTALSCEVLNRYESAALNTAEQALAYVEACGSDAIGIHLDGFHMAIEEVDSVSAIAAVGHRLSFLEFGQSGRGSIRDGAVDVAQLVTAARGQGYAGPIGFEAFSRNRMPEASADRFKVWRDSYSDAHGVATEAYQMLQSVLEGACP